MAADKEVKARGQVDDILKECEAAAVDNNNLRVVLTGLGNKVFPWVFKPLKHGPTVDITYEDAIDMDDLDINQDHKENITQRVLKMSIYNRTRPVMLTTKLQSDF